MDLVQTVRKEGSRGGVNFSWDDVKSSQHRENYLGHSLMAPVGRWQQGKDLNWYAKAEDADLTPEQRAERDREAKREELRKIKEAEEDAMARALGLPVPDRSNANEVPLGESRVSQKDLNRALKETLDGDKSDEEQGIGHKSGQGRRHSREEAEVEAETAGAGIIETDVRTESARDPPRGIAIIIDGTGIVTGHNRGKEKTVLQRITARGDGLGNVIIQARDLEVPPGTPQIDDAEVGHDHERHKTLET